MHINGYVKKCLRKNVKGGDNIIATGDWNFTLDDNLDRKCVSKRTETKGKKLHAFT